MPHYIHLKETPSTSTYACKMASLLPSGTVIYSYNQTAGRGQRGNSWEAEPGKNLSFSLLVKDVALKPDEQFYISEGVSLAIVGFLRQYAGEFSIKWPNDIYWRDKKICGMLIENTLLGAAIKTSVIGVGININQTVFRGGAPNPVSLAQIIGHETDLDDALRQVCALIERHTRFDGLTGGDLATLHSAYLRALYRNDGRPHPFLLPTGEEIMATITGVLPSGLLCLTHSDGSTRRYAFKEVSFKI